MKNRAAYFSFVEKQKIKEKEEEIQEPALNK